MVACGVQYIPQLLQTFASIGTCGKNSNNWHKDLMKLISRKTMVCPPLQVNIALKDGLYLQSIMLPHELFHCMWERYNAFFQSLIPAGEPGMRFFWDKFQQHPCMELATWTSHPSFPHKCIPLGLHGDAVPTTGVGKVWAKMQLCFSWNSLLKIGGTKATNFLIWSVPWLVYTSTGLRLLSIFLFPPKKPKERRAGDIIIFFVSQLSFEVFEPLLSRVTLDEVFQILNWSFACMTSGTFPSCDWKGRHFHVHSPAGQKAGSALAGGYIAPLLALQGDLEYFSTHLQMPRWNAASGCCILCRAGGSGVNSCKIYGVTAPWKETVWTASSWKA